MNCSISNKGVHLACVAALLCGIAVESRALGGAPPPPSNEGAEYTKTRYPIVLAHGLWGFESIGPVEYFYRIPGALMKDGAVVYTSKVSAANSSEVRGEQLLTELRRLRAVHGHQKFNLIGHSHGSHSVRYVAAMAPDLVASVLVVAGPNQGSVVADVAQKVLDGTGSTAIADRVFNVLGRLIDALGGGVKRPQSADGAMRSLTTAGSASFNQRFPQGAPTSPCGSGAAMVNGIRYYSASGTRVVTNMLDPDTAMSATQVLFRGRANDGLVERCSSRWGVVLRDNYPWNHTDIVNLTFGLRGPGTPDPLAFYRTHANRLKLAGL